MSYDPNYDVKHIGGYFVSPELMGRMQALLQYANEHSDNQVAIKLLGERCKESFDAVPPVIVHTAYSLKRA